MSEIVVEVSTDTTVRKTRLKATYIQHFIIAANSDILLVRLSAQVRRCVALAASFNPYRSIYFFTLSKSQIVVGLSQVVRATISDSLISGNIGIVVIYSITTLSSTIVPTTLQVQFTTNRDYYTSNTESYFISIIAYFTPSFIGLFYSIFAIYLVRTTNKRYKSIARTLLRTTFVSTRLAIRFSTLAFSLIPYLALVYNSLSTISRLSLLLFISQYPAFIVKASVFTTSFFTLPKEAYEQRSSTIVLGLGSRSDQEVVEQRVRFRGTQVPSLSRILLRNSLLNSAFLTRVISLVL